MRGIEFVNDLCCNYLTIPYEGGEEDFALRMMTENATDAFLPMELRRLDGQTYLYYNISGMQSMEVLYGEKPIDRKTFREFIWQLHAAIKESGELFLPGDGICLEPTSVFWELGTGRWKFLYMPGQETGQPAQMQGEREIFAEFLVMHIDYEDKELTETVYRFYEEMCAGMNFPWGELALGMAAQEKEQLGSENDVLSGEMPPERVEREEDWEGEFGRRTYDGSMGEEHPVSEWNARETEPAGIREIEGGETGEEWRLTAGSRKWKPQMIPWIVLGAAIALTIVSGKLMPVIALYSGAASGVFAVILLVVSIRRKKRGGDGGEEAREAVYECEMEYTRDTEPGNFGAQPLERGAEYGTEYGGRGFAADEKTVYMEIGEKQERKLYGIGKYKRQKIFLEKLPCLVGKDKTRADHVIADSSVSRMHAKFSMEGGTVWMQDLNSTNGTYHNGMRLKPNERVTLEAEDEVAFGRAQFVFR